MTTVETSVPGVIKYSSVVFASLSLLGTAYIFTSSIIHKRLRSFSFRMILWMCIFNVILCCATICGPLGTLEEESGTENEAGMTIIHQNIKIGNEYQSALPLTCKLQAASIQFSMFASLLWTFCFAIHLFRISSVNVDPNRTHSYTSLCIYLAISIPLPLFMTYYIFAKDIVGVSSDFWCWIKDEYMDEWSWKMLYIEVGIMVLILLILYFGMKIHLKYFIKHSNEEMLLISGNNNNINDANHRMLNRSRLQFVRTISGGLSSYLFAPFLSYVPAHFNFICTLKGLEWKSHVLSWYILSGVLLGVLHIGIYCCGLSIVRYSWTQTCCDEEQAQSNVGDNVEIIDCNVIKHQRRDPNIQFINRSLQQSQRHYMELV